MTTDKPTPRKLYLTVMQKPQMGLVYDLAKCTSDLWTAPHLTEFEFVEAQALTEAERTIAELREKLSIFTEGELAPMATRMLEIFESRRGIAEWNQELRTDNDTLREKLRIATEALEWIKNMANGVTIPFHANEALTKITNPKL